MTKKLQTNGLPFKDLYSYFKKVEDESTKMVISVGLLIDSGGIIGILTHTGGKLSGQLKIAFMFFIASIVSLFTVEMIKSIVAKKSIDQLFRDEDRDSANIDIYKFGLLKSWFNYVCNYLNVGTVACGIWGVYISFSYLQSSGLN